MRVRRGGCCCDAGPALGVESRGGCLFVLGGTKLIGDHD